MKKLMLAVAIVCAAAMSQAASFNWKTAKSNNVNSPADGAMVATTAYIFEATAAESIFNAFKAGNDWTIGSLDSEAITAAGKIASESPFTFGGEGQAATINTIFAFAEKIGDKDYLYISTASGDVAGPGTGSQNIQFKEAGVSTAVNDITGGYKGAGWYSQSVPEPTSGLLLLLGMAGLALRRKQK